MGSQVQVIYALFAAFVLWLPLALGDIGGQAGPLRRNNPELLSDFWMPRTCLAEGYAEVGAEFPLQDGTARTGWLDGKMRVRDYDRCYPAAALMPLVLFSESWMGAWCWTIAVGLVLIGALCLVSRAAWPMVLLCASPVLFNFERGNMVGLAAAGVTIFLAWYRSEKTWQRVCAALALSVATCFKISPVLLGTLYLRERDWKGIGWCVVFCTVLSAVPWFFVPEGWAALPQMLANAQGNFMEYVRASDFGLVQLWRTVRVLLHQDCMRLWPGCLAVARISQVLGLAAVAWGAWRRQALWVVVGMLWAAGNMHYYGALYLLPVFVLEVKGPCVLAGRARYGVYLRTVLWFIILCPLQVVLFGHSANAILCNLAAVGLLFGVDSTERRAMLG